MIVTGTASALSRLNTLRIDKHPVGLAVEIGIAVVVGSGVVAVVGPV